MIKLLFQAYHVSCPISCENHKIYFDGIALNTVNQWAPVKPLSKK